MRREVENILVLCTLPALFPKCFLLQGVDGTTNTSPRPNRPRVERDRNSDNRAFANSADSLGAKSGACSTRFIPSPKRKNSEDGAAGSSALADLLPLFFEMEERRRLAEGPGRASRLRTPPQLKKAPTAAIIASQSVRAAGYPGFLERDGGKGLGNQMASACGHA